MIDLPDTAGLKPRAVITRFCKTFVLGDDLQWHEMTETQKAIWRLKPSHYYHYEDRANHPPRSKS